MAYLTFDSDGIAFHLAGLPVRYYGLAIVCTLWSGFYIWLRQARRIGINGDLALRWLPWGALGVLIGARLGHCLLYEPMAYLRDPSEILRIWNGGASSHGAAAGLLLSSAFYARRYRLSIFEIFDQVALLMPTASFMRLGNFMNSEIVGKVTDVPWAVRFSRYADGGSYPRHPTQLYEFLVGVSVFLALVFIDRRLARLVRRPRGLLLAGLLLLYFVGRFVFEYTKKNEYSDLSSVLSMGQIPSLPAIVAGVVIIVISLRGGLGYYKRNTERLP